MTDAGRRQLGGNYDAIVLGGGHNGLIASAQLARAGARTLVLERRPQLGGCTDTSAPWPDHPDWRVNTYSYVAGLMPRRIVADLELHRHGLRLLPYGPHVVPCADGRALLLHHDTARTCRSIAAFSEKDAAAYPRWEAWLERIADVLWPLFTQTPPDLGSLRPRDLLETGYVAWRARRLGVRGVADVTRLFTGSVREILDDWFESDALKGALAMTATVGAYAGPEAPGTAYVLLHLTMGDPGEGHIGGWGFVRGGMGGLAEACRRAAEEQGVEIATGASAARLLVEGRRVQGVALADGTELRAPVVVSTIHPKTTFLELIDASQLPPAFVADIARFKCRGGAVKINLALGELPQVAAAEAAEAQDAAASVPPGAATGAREYHTGALELGFSPAYVQAAFDDAAAGRPAAHPISDGMLPSVLDDTLMPAGVHCLSLYTQWVPHEWHEEPHRAEIEAFADRVVEAYAAVAPNLPGATLARQVIGPYDMEQELGLVGGNVYGGELSVDQLFHMRPAPGYADYRSPVAGLYNGSAGAHGGGGVSGIPGWQAARRAIADRRRAGRTPRPTTGTR
jgi:phytoene dehydrogenase-like protein